MPVVATVCCALGHRRFQPPVRRFHVERFKKYLDLATNSRAKNPLLVLGEYIWQQEVIPPKEQWNWAVEHTQELGDYAMGLGLEIALELEPFQLSLVNDLDNMVRFIGDVDHPGREGQPRHFAPASRANRRRRRSSG